MHLKENDLVFAKVKEGAIIPSKEDENAGYDIYSCFDEDYRIVLPHDTELIPTGIASALSPKYYIQIEERGSTGSKGIKKSAGVIDSGYRGEWFVAITNSSNKDLIISKIGKDDLISKYGKTDDEGDVYIPYKNQRVYLNFSDGCPTDDLIIYPYNKAIAQAVVQEVPIMQVHEASYEELLTIKSDRGIGMLGSSKK